MLHATHESTMDTVWLVGFWGLCCTLDTALQGEDGLSEPDRVAVVESCSRRFQLALVLPETEAQLLDF